MGEAPHILVPARHKAAANVHDFNAIDDVAGMSAGEVSVAQYEMYLAHRIGEKLSAAYPQRRWGVAVNSTVGAVQITCPTLSATKGYVIHMHGKTLHDLQLRAVTAAGEILERFGISRARVFDPTTMELLKRDLRDEAVTADSGAGYAVKQVA